MDSLEFYLRPKRVVSQINPSRDGFVCEPTLIIARTSMTTTVSNILENKTKGRSLFDCVFYSLQTDKT